MINQFLTISEALKLLNNKKSYSTLNRLIRNLKSDKTTKQYIKTVKGKNLISKEYLLETFADLVNVVNHDDKNINQINHDDNTRQMIDLLKNQLDVKDEQINNLTSLVNDYSERLKESHYTIEGLSSKLALLESNKPKNSSGEDFNQWQKLLYKLGLIQK